jgi:hypothetical protein
MLENKKESGYRAPFMPDPSLRFLLLIVSSVLRFIASKCREGEEKKEKERK